MNLLKNSLTVFIFISLNALAQRQVKDSPAIVANSNNIPSSNIVRSVMADSAIVKLELKNAQYDLLKNNFPYYIISKRTSYNQTATPQIIIKKTQLVTDNNLAVIKKFYGKYLGTDFEAIQLSALCMGENLNQYKIHPFRINALNQVEELIEYDISWKISSNSNAQRLQSASSFKSSSVLGSGEWYKIAITKTGIHKIDRAFLISCGVPVENVKPENIRIYGNGGNVVEELNSAARYDDLEENAIQVINVNNDSKFDDGDYVLFYAKNKEKWKKASGQALKFSCEQNNYSDSAFYYINADLGPGKRINTQASSGSVPNATCSTYDYYNFHEQNNVNFVKSGRNFFGEYFDINNSYTFNFYDGDFVEGDTVVADVTIAGRGATNTIFNISGNGLNFNLTTYAVDVSNYLASYADVENAIQRTVNNNSSVISILISKSTPVNLGWLDKLTVNARRYLSVNKQFQFRDLRISKPGNICRFNISNPASQNINVWNVTNFLNPFIQQYNNNGNNLDFTAATDSLMEFAIAPDNDFYSPVFVSKIGNQNLHSQGQADYLIITHPLFTSHANRLALLHEQKEGLTYAIATTEQVYNEFSSGMTDISAIRDYIKMFYSRHISTGKQPKYVLLLGDGSYDNKNKSLVSNSNLIPTYQTPFSLGALNSIATDDFYALMDPNEGIGAENIGSLDIGIGRLTVKNVGEADAVVNKIESYYRKDDNFQISDPVLENCTTNAESPFGDWKNWIIFLGDDEDQSQHTADANTISKKVQLQNPNFNLDKIFLDAYQQFSTPGGQRYPDAYIDLQKRIKKGALIFNYTGHGGEVGLTAERLIDVETINAWDNFSKLPLFVTATCEFTRYDDPGRTSAGELCLLNAKGGAVALLTTCRLAFSTSNLILNLTLYDFMFKKLPNGKKPCLGDVIRRAKDTLNQSLNFSNFHLIGDPAMTLSYPEQKVITSKINSSIIPLVQNTLTPTSDTLGALQKITISGFIADTLGNKLTNFNGIVYPSVFDKEQTVTGLLNDESSYDPAFGLGTPYKFLLQKNILYRGKAEVKNGDFSFSFIVPKDISFAYGPGKISYYATNGQSDAAGCFKNVIVGGGATNALFDNAGPQVTIYLNDKNFVNGGTTNEKPVLYAHLTDSSGINTIGSSIGHDITAVLDGNLSKPVVLNDYYEANLNSYQAGRIRYPFEELSEGNHQLTFKVWDIQNNSNVVSADFVVAPSAELALNHVLNYPNPFTSKTKFFLEHNQACNPLKVTVQVFSISGKLVKTIQKTVTCEGFRPEGIDWDGKDDFGDKLGRGVYIYKVAILNTDNKKAEKTEKLVILN